MTDRDRQRLAGVHPHLVAMLVPIIDAHNMFVVVGVRTAEEQHVDWLKGRAADGTILDKHAIVTNCDGYYHKSPHQVREDGFGHAVDCAFNGPGLPYSGDFHAFGAALESVGLKWGGRFSHPIDLDHAELA